MSIDVQRDGHIATVTINQPDKLNALNAERLRALFDAVTEVSRDPAVRAIILTGAGNRAFVSGADIKEMASLNANEALDFARLGHAAATALESAPQPVIAAINGFALGGGCELALACDIRIASTNAVFAQPEVTLGIPPGWGGSQRLVRLVGAGMAAEMIFTGRRVPADAALRIGLVNAVHQPDQLLDAARDLAEAIATNSPVAVRASKRLLALSRNATPAAGLAEEAHLFSEAFGSADQTEGMAAFLEKRPPKFQD